MKKNILAFLIIGGVGILLHFLYDWTGQNAIVGIFSAVNESTWEHLKLLFVPAVIYSAFEFFLRCKNTKNFWPAVTLGILAAMLIITTLFYTYTGILGFNVDFINILIYFISIIVFIRTKNKIIREETFTKKNAVNISLTIIAVLALLFAYWSFNPPSLGIFTPPIIE